MGIIIIIIVILTTTPANYYVPPQLSSAAGHDSTPYTTHSWTYERIINRCLSSPRRVAILAHVILGRAFS